MNWLMILHLRLIGFVIAILQFFHCKTLANKAAYYGLCIMLKYLRKVNLAQYIHAKRKLKQLHPEYDFH